MGTRHNTFVVSTTYLTCTFYSPSTTPIPSWIPSSISRSSPFLFFPHSSSHADHPYPAAECSSRTSRPRCRGHQKTCCPRHVAREVDFLRCCNRRACLVPRRDVLEEEVQKAPAMYSLAYAEFISTFRISTRRCCRDIGVSLISGPFQSFVPGYPSFEWSVWVSNRSPCHPCNDRRF